MNVVSLCDSHQVALRQAIQSLAPLFDALQEAVWVVDARTRSVLAVNDACARLLGPGCSEYLGRNVEALVCTPEDMAFWEEVASGHVPALHSDALVRHSDGHLLWVSRSVTGLDLQGHGPIWLVAMSDQTRQRQVEEQREVLIAELKATLESTADGILVTDLAGRMSAFNQRFAFLWGLPEELLTQRDDEAIQAWMRRSVLDPTCYTQMLAGIQEAPLMQSRDTVTLLTGRVLERVSMPQWSRGRPIGRVFSFRDLSDKLAADQRLEELAQTDLLTGLPNRRVLKERMEFAQALARREQGSFAVLSVDLDRFKQINDTLGQGYGDRVLKEVAVRLRECLREVDTISRIGADEFALLVHYADAKGAELTARRIQDAMARPFTFDALSFTITCCIGIALFPGDGQTSDELMVSAARAMHWVKESGRAAYRFHQVRQEVDLLSQMQLDHAMRRALAEGEFRLHYQPQIALDGDRVVGVEALIRWTDPSRGPVSPADFIPMAEESGFIIAIGEWVLNEAVLQAAAWLAAGHPLPVAINVSALQFLQPNFVDTVAAALERAQLPPYLLELELTESILLRDAEEAQRRLHRLAELGVQLAIDDFGTGYSSLVYLKRLPLQRLKIDRSFVRGLPQDASDAGIVNAIIQLGRALKLTVIAEGVENQAQRQFLADAGCHECQGYLYAPALPASEMVTQMGIG